jgi:hypothetical protein
MSRVLLALALGLALGGGPALQVAADLFAVAWSASAAPDAGGSWDPNGGGPQPNAGSSWDPDGGAQSDAGSKWDPNG